MPNLLPRGVKRHIQNRESAQVIAVMLSSKHEELSMREISEGTNLPYNIVMSRLVRLRDFGIVDMRRTPVSSMWSIPLYYQQPLHDYLEVIA